jgi:hypothetical protein
MRLEVYTTILPSPMMMDLIIKVIVECYSCSMGHREIYEGVVGERQDTGCAREIGSVNKGRRAVGCCINLGCRPWYFEHGYGRCAILFFDFLPMSKYLFK